MMMNYGFSMGLSAMPLVSNAQTRAINAENMTGKKGNGGREASNLGVGRKGKPCLKLPKGETITLAEIDGTGVIRHFWMTVTDRTNEGCFVLRDLILRIFWDNEENPSVEAPLGDFFCNGFAARCDINSLPIVVNPVGGMNCYFQMPFRKAAKITIENQHAADIDHFFYQVDYEMMEELPLEAAYFHAQWRREKITSVGKDYTILEGVKGKGQYVGTYLAWAALERYWWGEGEMKFYMDGDVEWPTICGTGTEDYFGGAWAFSRKRDGRLAEHTYCTPYLGYPFYSSRDETLPDNFADDCMPMHGLYRWHVMDPIRFDENLRVTIQQIGVCNRGLFERQDDISSVAYWYQLEPHNKFPVLPSREERWPR